MEASAEETKEFGESRLHTLFDEIEHLADDAKLTEGLVRTGVESVRSVSEILIYSKKKGLTYFEVFMERNLMGLFLRILKKANDELNKQIIQTVSILIQNIKKEEELFYMLSHEFMNELICFDFDLALNNELVDHFISFLKMLTINIIDESKIQFFYNK